MNTVTTKDGTEIYYRDWGSKNAQPIVFHHGWPLSADDWDTQFLYFLGKGYRVIAHDRRGHGRSFLGIAAQAFLAIVVIFHILPWFGLGLLDTARDLEEFDLPMR